MLAINVLSAVESLDAETTWEYLLYIVGNLDHYPTWSKPAYLKSEFR